jgi:hypothetical protein
MPRPMPLGRRMRVSSSAVTLWHVDKPVCTGDEHEQLLVCRGGIPWSSVCVRLRGHSRLVIGQLEVREVVNNRERMVIRRVREVEQSGERLLVFGLVCHGLAVEGDRLNGGTERIINVRHHAF